MYAFQLGMRMCKLLPLYKSNSQKLLVVLDTDSGIIYHGSFHFTARLIDKTMNTYYYDGIKTGPECILEGKFNTIENVYKVDQRKASTLVYTLL